MCHVPCEDMRQCGSHVQNQLHGIPHGQSIGAHLPNKLIECLTLYFNLSMMSDRVALVQKGGEHEEIILLKTAQKTSEPVYMDIRVRFGHGAGPYRLQNVKSTI